MIVFPQVRKMVRTPPGYQEDRRSYQQEQEYHQGRKESVQVAGGSRMGGGSKGTENPGQWQKSKIKELNQWADL